MRARPLLAGVTLLAAACSAALAQTVSLQGLMGSRALLIIDGGMPRALSPGEVQQGVKLVSVANGEAVIEVDGRRERLRLGETQASVGAAASATRGNRIVLTADGGGHFLSEGTVNGRAARFMVDTGATLVALGADEAERLGINYRAGRPGSIGTANGVAQAWKVRLASLRVGAVELYDVEAVVSPQPMPYVLLGNNFLGRFQMLREADQMVLERRY